MHRKNILYSLLIFALVLSACSAAVATPVSSPTAVLHDTLQLVTTPVPSVTIPPSATPTLVPSATATPLPSQTPTATRVPTETPFPTQVVDDFGVAMVLVPAGPFLMGSGLWNENERPEHMVTLKAYYIDQFEVSNASFSTFLNEKGNQIEGNAPWIEEADPDLRIHKVDGVWTPDDGYADHPINETTWFAARAYCAWRGVRLPTEAEWEKAARGDDGRTYPWGEETPTCEMANFAGCFYDSVPVDSYPQSVSPYGAYNMAGNVMEWVADWYVRHYDADDSEDPTGPENGDFRIFRGGAWFTAATQVRTTYRFAKLPVLTFQANGFRCARDIGP
ncbi:MAG: SUMF1/EgtB/PvdO family nonheme iron enzyme [Chloroflexota bacterium]